jgi:hypothetical protein
MLSGRVPLCKSPTVVGPLALRTFVILGKTRRDSYRAAVEPLSGGVIPLETQSVHLVMTV